MQRSLALGYIPAELAGANEGFEIEMIGERRRATRLSAAPHSILTAAACAAERARERQAMKMASVVAVSAGLVSPSISTVFSVLTR